MARRRTSLFTVLALACALLLAACGGSEAEEPEATTAAATGTPAGSADVALQAPGEGECACDDSAIGATSIIRDGAFEGDLEIPVGQTVTWVNDDGAEHIVKARDDSFTSESLAPDTSYTRRFEAAGAVEIYCELHPEMTMTVTVG